LGTWARPLILGPAADASPDGANHHMSRSSPVTLTQARAAKNAARRRFRAVGDVVSVGITRVDVDYAVKINLREAPRRDVEVPREIDGVPVRVEVTGAVRKRKAGRE